MNYHSFIHSLNEEKKNSIFLPVKTKKKSINLFRSLFIEKQNKKSNKITINFGQLYTFITHTHTDTKKKTVAKNRSFDLLNIISFYTFLPSFLDNHHFELFFLVYIVPYVFSVYEFEMKMCVQKKPTDRDRF